jgi:hypothetical protein
LSKERSRGASITFVIGEIRQAMLDYQSGRFGEIN